MDSIKESLLFDKTTWMLLGTLGATLLLYDYWKKTIFWRNGMPGPMPLPIFGNVFAFRKGITTTLTKYCEKYGKTFGVTFLKSRWLIVCDLDFLQKILISQFSSFPNHGPDNPFIFDKMTKKALIALNDTNWKDARNTLTPAFSGSKMKQMTALMEDCCKNLLAKIEELQDQKFIQCKDLYGAFTMDVVASTFFGLQLNSQRNPKDRFAQYAKEALNVNMLSFRYLIGSMSPLMERLFDAIDYGVYPRHIKKFFTELTNQVIKSREKETGQKRMDILQLMVNAHQLEGEQEDGNHGDANSHQHNKAHFTSDDIATHTFSFFLAAYDTTNTTLGFTCYLLATNPEQQDKLIAEIEQFAPKEGEPLMYKELNEMEYLDMVIKETLRLYPAASVTDRFCTHPTVIEGIEVPANTDIFVPIYLIHHDPEIWEDPESFKPERFSKENADKIHPMAWIPFGSGPRICIGMRLAMMEMKYAIIRILQKYRFETCPETEIPPVLNPKTALISPPNGIKLRIVPRK